MTLYGVILIMMGTMSDSESELDYDSESSANEELPSNVFGLPRSDQEMEAFRIKRHVERVSEIMHEGKQLVKEANGLEQKTQKYLDPRGIDFGESNIEKLDRLLNELKSLYAELEEKSEHIPSHTFRDHASDFRDMIQTVSTLLTRSQNRVDRYQGISGRHPKRPRIIKKIPSSVEPTPKPLSERLRHAGLLNEKYVSVDEFRLFFKCMWIWNEDGYEDVSHFQDKINGFGSLASAHGTQCVFDVWRRFFQNNKYKFQRPALLALDSMTLEQCYDWIETSVHLNLNVVERARQFLDNGVQSYNHLHLKKWASVIHKFVSIEVDGRPNVVRKVIKALSRITMRLDSTSTEFTTLNDILLFYLEGNLCKNVPAMPESTFLGMLKMYKEWKASLE